MKWNWRRNKSSDKNGHEIVRRRAPITYAAIVVASGILIYWIKLLLVKFSLYANFVKNFTVLKTSLNKNTVLYTGIFGDTLVRWIFSSFCNVFR